MKKKTSDLTDWIWPYAAPQIETTEVQAEGFICTTVTPNVPASTEEDWDADTEIDGGEIQF